MLINTVSVYFSFVSGESCIVELVQQSRINIKTSWHLENRCASRASNLFDVTVSLIETKLNTLRTVSAEETKKQINLYHCIQAGIRKSLDTGCPTETYVHLTLTGTRPTESHQLSGIQ